MELKQEQLLELYLGELIGLKKIGKRVHKDPRTLKKEIEAIGITVPYPGSTWTKVKRHVEGKFFRPIPRELKEMITGSLLGDAQLRVQTKQKITEDPLKLEKYCKIVNQMQDIQKRIKKREKITIDDIKLWNNGVKSLAKVNTASLRFHKSILELEWLKALIAEFNSFIKVKVFVKPNRTKSSKWSCGFETAASIQFFELWRDWYTIEKGKLRKKLFKFRAITPNTLLHWYVGDGYLTKNELALSTHSFTLNEQSYLVKLLNAIGVKAKTVKKLKHYYIRLSTKQENINNFFSYMREAKLYKKAEKCFPYKFSNEITKAEWKKQLMKEHPEYFILDYKLREKLLQSLLKN